MCTVSLELKSALDYKSCSVQRGQKFTCIKSEHKFNLNARSLHTLSSIFQQKLCIMTHLLLSGTCRKNTLHFLDKTMWTV